MTVCIVSFSSGKNGNECFSERHFHFLGSDFQLSFQISNSSDRSNIVLNMILLSLLLLICKDSWKSDPKKWKWRSEKRSFLFFPLNFLKIKLYRAPLNHINWQEMGKSPDEQPFLAAYKLRLAKLPLVPITRQLLWGSHHTWEHPHISGRIHIWGCFPIQACLTTLKGLHYL